MSTPTFFPILDFASRVRADRAFTPEQVHQVNTVLSFVRYILCDRDIMFDSLVAAKAMRMSNSLSRELTLALSLSEPITSAKGAPVWAALVDWHAAISNDFTGMLFKAFAQPARGEGPGVIEEALDRIEQAAKQRTVLQLSDRAFTRFDAVAILIRYAHLDVPYIQGNGFLYDGLMESLIQAMAKTTRFTPKEREEIGFLARALSAFRVSAAFPCETVVEDGKARVTSNLENPLRVNAFLPLFNSVRETAGEEVSLDVERCDVEDLGGMAPFIAAWAVLSPRKNEELRKWYIGTNQKVGLWSSLFTSPTCRPFATQLHGFLTGPSVDLTSELAEWVMK